MNIVQVKFINLNAEETSVEITDNDCSNLRLCKSEIELINTAYAYVRDNNSNFVALVGVEIIAC